MRSVPLCGHSTASCGLGGLSSASSATGQSQSKVSKRAEVLMARLMVSPSHGLTRSSAPEALRLLCQGHLLCNPRGSIVRQEPAALHYAKVRANGVATLGVESQSNLFPNDADRS